MSGGSRNTIPLVGNTGGASPCVRVLNHPAPGRGSAGIRGSMVKVAIAKSWDKKIRSANAPLDLVAVKIGVAAVSSDWRKCPAITRK
jgi:hypothetical protein